MGTRIMGVAPDCVIVDDPVLLVMGSFDSFPPVTRPFRGAAGDGKGVGAIINDVRLDATAYNQSKPTLGKSCRSGPIAYSAEVGPALSLFVAPKPVRGCARSGSLFRRMRVRIGE